MNSYEARLERNMTKLYNAHEKEAKRRGAEFYNQGHVQSPWDIGSKTSKGYLTTTLSRNGRITHKWGD